MKYRALAFDLDGTLLDRNEQVSRRNRKALADAKAAGYTLIVASARWRQLAEDISRQIGTSAPLIACSGAEVWLREERRHLLDLRLPEEFSHELFAICDANRCVATISDGDDVFVKLDGEPDPAEMPPGMRWVPSLAAASSGHPRIALIQGSATVAMIEEQLAPRWAEAVRFVESMSSRGKRILTLTAQGADKGVALDVACEWIGVHPEEVVAFGDAENDVEMFRVAGASVAMGQARDYVKEHATTVTGTNEEDGVAMAVERLLREGALT